jgi:hypothetical protein
MREDEIEYLKSYIEEQKASFDIIMKEKIALNAEIAELKAASDFDHKEYKRLRNELNDKVAMMRDVVYSSIHAKTLDQQRDYLRFARRALNATEADVLFVKEVK